MTTELNEPVSVLEKNSLKHTRLIAISQLLLLIKEHPRKIKKNFLSDLKEPLNFLNKKGYCEWGVWNEEAYSLDIPERGLDLIKSRINPKDLNSKNNFYLEELEYYSKILCI